MITSDLANPESNRNKTAGFTDQEREAFTKLLKAGFVVSLFIYLFWRCKSDTIHEKTFLKFYLYENNFFCIFSLQNFL